MSLNGLADWQVDAQQTESARALEDKIESAAIGIKYGANPFFYKSLMQIYMQELRWRQSASTAGRSYCARWRL